MEIGMNQTWHGKKVYELTDAEREEMEKSLNIIDEDITYTINDDGSEVKAKEATPPEPEPKPKKKYVAVRINGHDYDSWEDAIKGEAKSGFVKVIDHADSITISNGKIIIDGEESSTKGQQNVFVFVKGNADSIRMNRGKIEVEGNVREIHATQGSVHCKDITGNVHATQGSVTADTIKGDVRASMGVINYNGK